MSLKANFPLFYHFHDKYISMYVSLTKGNLIRVICTCLPYFPVLGLYISETETEIKYRTCSETTTFSGLATKTVSSSDGRLYVWTPIITSQPVPGNTLVRHNERVVTSDYAWFIRNEQRSRWNSLCNCTRAKSSLNRIFVKMTCSCQLEWINNEEIWEMSTIF